MRLIRLLPQVARITKGNLYIRVRIGSEYVDVVAACTEDPTLLPPVVVRFDGASLTNDGELEHCLPKVDMDANHALVLVPAGPPAHRPVRTTLSDPPHQTSDIRLAGASSAARGTAVEPHQVMLSYK
ncbi:hypothetical protein HDU82_000290 [Entophlyctis luteolus]|nr:hypothetical protein HDU82_000290 [Entophlyctis luteolus]